MIDVVTPELRPIYTKQLDQMFRQRYEVFVERFGWDLPAKGAPDRLEHDQFDTLDAIYLLASEDGASVQGGARLLPSMGPHLMSELFAHLCERELPQADDIWELSRFYVFADHLSPREQHQAAQALSVGLIELGLLYGIRNISFQTTTDMLYVLEGHGYEYSFLGEPVDVGEGAPQIAGLLNVSVSALNQMRTVTGIAAPVIHIQRTRRAA